MPNPNYQKIAHTLRDLIQMTEQDDEKVKFFK
jgi:hypothetical protein